MQTYNNPHNNDIDFFAQADEAYPCPLEVPNYYANINCHIYLQCESRNESYTLTDIQLNMDGNYSLSQICQVLLNGGILSPNTNLYYKELLDGVVEIYHHYSTGDNLYDCWLPSSSVILDQGVPSVHLKVQNILPSQPALQLAKLSFADLVQENENMNAKTCDNTPVSDQSGDAQSFVSFDTMETKSGKTDHRSDRHPERTINQVVDLIRRWRRNYQDAMKAGQKLNLDGCAKLVGVPRKSLDDYSNKLNKAKKLGFKFDVHGGEGFGYLRQYVARNMSKLEKKVQDCWEDL